jgi:hypothetical protein
MKYGRDFLCVALLLCMAALTSGIVRQQGASKRKHLSVKGRLIGYSMMSQFRWVSGHTRTTSLPHDAFLFLVERGEGELKAGEFVKLQYRATPEHPEELPAAFFDESSQSSFLVERDRSCDESTESFIRGVGPKSEGWDAGEVTRPPNLVRLRGAENVPLPEGRTLRCYGFDRDGIAK